MRADRLQSRAFEALDRLHPGGALGVAVSGGGDSVALALLAARWGAQRGISVRLATVDHGLRPESRDEAARVAALAARLGLPHHILDWPDAPGTGNLADAARRARLSLLARWGAGCGAIALGHTRDDQAETVLMRLLRGSGVDGLSAMAEESRLFGARWLRPLLGEARAALRAWLAAQGEGWVEDPSNDDLARERPRIRAAMAALGLDPAGLADTATRLRRARIALEAQTETLWETARIGACGEVLAPAPALADAPDEIALRWLASALRYVSGAAYPPRLASLEAARAALLDHPHGGRALHGCLLDWRSGALAISREPASIRDMVEDGVFDRRWRVSGDGAVAALGESGRQTLLETPGWAPPPGWAVAPLAAQRAAPALWREGVLVCAPLAGYGDGLCASLLPRRDDSAL